MCQRRKRATQVLRYFWICMVKFSRWAMTAFGQNEFESPGKLLGDFWDEVELIMSEPAGEI
jgi:hypothetical protein